MQQTTLTNGTNTWSSLTYFTDAAAILGAAPETLDTLGELAAAISDNPDFYQDVLDNETAIGLLSTDLTDAVTTLNGSISDTLTSANTIAAGYVTAAVDTLEVADTVLQNNITSVSDTLTAVDASLVSSISVVSGTVQTLSDALDQEILDSAAAVDVHNGTSLDVHGIADTSLLATKSYADDAADAGELAATVASALDATAKADAAELAAGIYADDAVDTHNLDTTSVHGIADTSLLATTANVSAAQTAAEGYADGLAVNYDAVGSAAAAQTAAEGHADGAVTTHNADTTSVHGIADTSKIVMSDAVSTTLDGALVVTGDFTVNGSNFVNSASTITIEDNIVLLASGNAGNVVDLGLVVLYNDGVEKRSGLVRDVSDDTWKLFDGVTSAAGTTVAFAEGSLDNLSVNNITAAGVVFSDGTQTLNGIPSITPIAGKTGSYTLSSLTERDSLIEVNSGSASTVTIPEDSTLNFPVGTTLDILQTGAGQVTIAGASGVTVNATPGLKLRTQWSSVTLLKRSANLWVVYGDTAA